MKGLPCGRGAERTSPLRSSSQRVVRAHGALSSSVDRVPRLPARRARRVHPAAASQAHRTSTAAGCRRRRVERRGLAGVEAGCASAQDARSSIPAGSRTPFRHVGEPEGGASVFRRARHIVGHGDFLHQAVTVEDLGATLENYEPVHVRQYPYLSVKGPGILLFFRGLNIVANSAPLRPLLDLVAPSETAVRAWVINREVAAGSPTPSRMWTRCATCWR